MSADSDVVFDDIVSNSQVSGTLIGSGVRGVTFVAMASNLSNSSSEMFGSLNECDSH